MRFILVSNHVFQVVAQSNQTEAGKGHIVLLDQTSMGAQRAQCRGLARTLV